MKEQLSFGTDKETINKILSGITYAESGDMVCYAPEFYKEQGYVVVGRVDRERRTEHKGKNINVTFLKLTQTLPCLHVSVNTEIGKQIHKKTTPIIHLTFV